MRSLFGLGIFKRLFSTSAETLPEFGAFAKKLDAFMKDPSSLNAMAHGVSQSDLQSIGNDPNVTKLLLLDHHSHSQSHGPEFAKSLRHFAISYFARCTNDTGSPEVQIAISTVRMAILQHHLADRHHKDVKTKRALQQVVDERKKMFRYLRRLSLERFYTMLDRLGLPATFIDESETKYPFNYRVKKEFKVPANRTVRGGLNTESKL
jgi:small subunit ribosomal protein S15